MKKIQYLMIAIIIFSADQGFAQCTFLSPTVDIKSTTTSGPSCTVNLDLSFDIDANNGNKFIFVHIWKEVNYPILSPADAPTAAQLSASVLNIVIDNNGTPILLSTYTPATTIVVQNPSNNPGMTVVKTAVSATVDRFTISNVKITALGACTGSFTYKGYAWSTNSNSSNPKVHCSMPPFELGINDPLVTGYCVKGFPGSAYNFNISTSSSNMNVYYDVYLDNGDGIFVPSSDILIHSRLIASAITITPTTPFNSGNMAYPAAYDDLSFANRKIFVVVRTVGKSYVLLQAIAPCTPDIYDFGDLPTTGLPGATVWPAAKAKIVGNYSAGAPFKIDASVVSNADAVWAGNATGVRGTPFTLCLDGKSPSADCDLFDDGFAMPLGPLVGGVSYPFAVTVNSNLSGATVYYGFWIDWNNNGNFADDVDAFGNPAFYSGNTTTMSPRTVLVDVITAAFGVASNQYKVRLIVAASPVTSTMYNSTSIVNGEVEDYLAPAAIVLPLKFGALGAMQKDCGIEVRFETKSEIDNKFFRIEQSRDGIEWHVISVLQSKGPGDHVYSFTDNSASAGKNFYKVQQVDKDARYTYSDVFTAVSKCDGDIVVGPNPMHDNLNVRLPLTWENVNLILYNAKGQRMSAQRVAKGGSVSINTTQLPTGTYSLQVIKDNVHVAQKVLIKE